MKKENLVNYLSKLFRVKFLTYTNNYKKKLHKGRKLSKEFSNNSQSIYLEFRTLLYLGRFQSFKICLKLREEKGNKKKKKLFKA